MNYTKFENQFFFVHFQGYIKFFLSWWHQILSSNVGLNLELLQMDSTSVGQLLIISKHGHIWLFKNLHIKQRDGSKLPEFCLGWILTELVLFSLVIISYVSLVLQVIEKNSEKQNQFLNILSVLLLPKLVFFSNNGFNQVKLMTSLQSSWINHQTNNPTCHWWLRPFSSPQYMFNVN